MFVDEYVGWSYCHDNLLSCTSGPSFIERWQKRVPLPAEYNCVANALQSYIQEYVFLYKNSLFFNTYQNQAAS